jgi:hypothetical protein
MTAAKAARQIGHDLVRSLAGFIAERVRLGVATDCERDILRVIREHEVRDEERKDQAEHGHA